jgi:ribosomal protein S6--L-glutamate ligase
MKLALLLVRHPPTRPSPIMPEVMRLLSEWNCEVTVLEPDERPLDTGAIRVEHDLYVLKSGSELALSLAGALHAQGAHIVNPFPVSLACRDKVMTTALLQAAGLPVPETRVTTRLADVEALLIDGPVVCKPARGSQGRGVRVVHHAYELAGLARAALPGEPWLAQRYHQADGVDRKLYSIGGQVFGVERVWPARTYEEKLGRPFTVDETLSDLVQRCGSAVGGLSLFGVDVVESGGAPYVVDMSSFPGFKGVRDAALRIADHLYWTARSSLPLSSAVPV